MEVKFVVSDPKTGKSYQTVISNSFIGKKIGDVIEGESLGLKGYEVEVTGGSDNSGFPMKKWLNIIGRKKIVMQIDKKLRKKKTVRGNTISNETAQINAKIVKYGAKPVTELWNIKEKAKEEKPEVKEEKKESAGKKEEAKETKKEEKAVEKATEKHEIKKEVKKS